MSGEIFKIGSGPGVICNVGLVGVASASNTTSATVAEATVLASKAAIFGRVLVPTGKKLVVRSAGVTPEDGVEIATVKAQAYDVDGAAEICSTASSAEEFTTGNEAAAGTVVAFRLVNGSAALVVASAFVTYSIIDA